MIATPAVGRGLPLVLVGYLHSLRLELVKAAGPTWQIARLSANLRIVIIFKNLRQKL